MSIKRCGRLTITKTSTKARTRAPFRTPVGSSRDNLYGNSRDVISPPWQTLAGGATTHEPTYPAHVLPRWPRTFHRERERGCHVHIITKSGHRFIEPRTSDARSLVCPSILLSCKRVHAPLCAITTSDLCGVRVCARTCARECVCIEWRGHCRIFPPRFYVLDLINTISLTFVTDRRVPIGSTDKDEFKYRDLCPSWLASALWWTR